MAGTSSAKHCWLKRCDQVSVTFQVKLSLCVKQKQRTGIYFFVTILYCHYFGDVSIHYIHTLYVMLQVHYYCNLFCILYRMKKIIREK